MISPLLPCQAAAPQSCSLSPDLLSPGCQCSPFVQTPPPAGQKHNCVQLVAAVHLWRSPHFHLRLPHLLLLPPSRGHVQHRRLCASGRFLRGKPCAPLWGGYPSPPASLQRCDPGRSRSRIGSGPGCAPGAGSPTAPGGNAGEHERFQFRVGCQLVSTKTNEAERKL